jgi:hypothetical protein
LQQNAELVLEAVEGRWRRVCESQGRGGGLGKEEEGKPGQTGGRIHNQVNPFFVHRRQRELLLTPIVSLPTPSLA